MSEKPRGTLSLPKRTILDDLKPEPVEVCDSCKTVKFKFQCHAFKSEVLLHKIPIDHVAYYGLPQRKQGFNQVVNGHQKAGLADVRSLIECVRAHFGNHEADQTAKRVESLMVLEHLRLALGNSRKD